MTSHVNPIMHESPSRNIYGNVPVKSTTYIQRSEPVKCVLIYTGGLVECLVQGGLGSIPAWRTSTQGTTLQWGEAKTHDPQLRVS